jgi:hypothetical protein
MELLWFQTLNNTNKNELLTLANHNRDEYNSSYYSFLMILIKVDALNKKAVIWPKFVQGWMIG